jgi:hypothetical protein
MTISYENTDADAIAWDIYRCYKTKPGQKEMKRGLITFLVLFHLLFGVLFTLLLPGQTGRILAATLLSGMLMTASVAHRGRQYVEAATRQYIKRGLFDHFLGHRTVTLKPEGYHIAWEEGETLLRWSRFKRWESDASHLYLFWSEEEFGSIPLRAFRNPAHMQQFLETLEEYREAAVNGVPVPVIAPILVMKPTVTEAPPKTENSRNWWRDEQNIDTDSNNHLRRQ